MPAFADRCGYRLARTPLYVRLALVEMCFVGMAQEGSGPGASVTKAGNAPTGIIGPTCARQGIVPAGPARAGYQRRRELTHIAAPAAAPRGHGRCAAQRSASGLAVRLHTLKL